MKPVELKVSGLHSFREEQTIDFSALSEAGIFGIFGPTGSGKSSLLDAITLALYGKVERASKNTQGIMNHAEDKLSVSFTFELKKEPVEQYRVERMYRRTKEGGLKIGNCRFIKVNEETEVLADKERDVTQAVQDLLGLTHEDFTRAVVLPQGKFSEFLTLKGADRRKMLQRLFQLEKYGDALNDQLRQRIGNISVKIKEIAAEQQGLGDASQETVAQHLKAHEAACKQLAELKKILASSEEQYQFLKEKWNMQQEWNQTSNELEKVSENQEHISKLEQQAIAGEKAAGVMPVLEEWETTSEQLKSTAAALKEKELHLHQLREKTKTAKEKAEYAKTQREKLDPELQQKQNTYLEGKRIKEAVLRDQQVLAKTNRLIQAEQGNLEKVNEKLILQEKERLKINENLKQLALKINNLTISSEERQELQNAMQEKHHLKSEMAQLQEDRAAWKDFKRQMTRLETDAEQLKIEKENWNRKGIELFNKAGLYYEQAASMHFNFEQAETLLAEEKTRLETAMKDSEEKKLSRALVHTLEDGRPCPVCGSVDHPAPAVEEEDSSQHLDGQHQMLNRLSQDISAGLQQTVRLKDRLEQQADRLGDKMENQAEAARVSKELNERYENQPLEKWKTIIKNWLTDCKGSEQELLQLQEQAGNWEKQGVPLLQKEEKLQNESGFYQGQMNQLVDKAEKRKKSIEESKNNWEKRFANFPYDELDKLWEKSNQNDKEAESASAELKMWEEKDARLISETEHETSIKQSIMIKISEYKGSADARQTAIESQLDQLKTLSITMEDPIEEWQQQLTRQRETLKSDQQISDETHRKLEKELTDGENQLTKLQTITESLKERQETVDRRLNLLKKELNFDSNEAIHAAFLSKEERQNMQDEIKSHHEKTTQLKHQLDRLRILLGDKTFSEEDFLRSERNYHSAKRNYEDGLQTEARLRNEWEKLNERAVRFNKLEQDKIQQEEQFSRHIELQKLFKGNVFVEFVAEEQLHHICIAASKRLGELTRSRYALEVDSGGGFVIRDDANGGIKRPVSSLSGGETFLTSLALALSLSEQIQLSGEVPLQFFFLDEGFGTLDQGLLDTVITALEKLHINQLSIGIISHVPELQERLPKKIIVTPAAAGGEGSRIAMKTT